MLAEISELIGLQVYTKDAVFLGNVNNVILDVEGQTIEGLFIGGTNPLLIEDSQSVSVPFRWINSIGDIILLKYFPKKVSVSKSKPVEGMLE